MKQARRSFLKSIPVLATSAVTWPINTSLGNTEKPLLIDFSDNILQEHGEVWDVVRLAFRHTPNIINLNNGAISPQPIMVEQAFEAANRKHNLLPAKHLISKAEEKREIVREQLALMGGCSPNELALTRNATEALTNIIKGLPLTTGDEVVVSSYDYPHTLNAWKQRATREGIVLKWVDISLPSADEAAIVECYQKAVTERTKLIMVTHMMSWNGQIMPVEKITTLAHSQGVEVMVDAAHSFCHLDFKLSDLTCDYLGASLHKWLCAPFGSGLMYIKEAKIEKMFPLFAAFDFIKKTDIRKFEINGTRPIATEEAILEALVFHHQIGSTKKQVRLHFLKEYWTTKVTNLPKVSLLTDLSPIASCGMATFGIEGFTPKQLYETLKERFGIYTSAIYHPLVPGVRVSPHIYTSLEELDKLVNAVEELVNK